VCAKEAKKFFFGAPLLLFRSTETSKPFKTGCRWRPLPLGGGFLGSFGGENNNFGFGRRHERDPFNFSFVFSLSSPWLLLFELQKEF